MRVNECPMTSQMLTDHYKSQDLFSTRKGQIVFGEVGSVCDRGSN